MPRLAELCFFVERKEEWRDDTGIGPLDIRVKLSSHMILYGINSDFMAFFH